MDCAPGQKKVAVVKRWSLVPEGGLYSPNMTHDFSRN